MKGDRFMSGRLSERVSFRLAPDLYMKVLADAEREGCEVAVIVRVIVEQHYAGRAISDAILQIEEAVERVLAPSVEKITELLVHAGVAGGTSAWMTKALFRQLVPEDVVHSDEVFIAAETRAKENVRRLRMTSLAEDE